MNTTLKALELLDGVVSVSCKDQTIVVLATQNNINVLLQSTIETSGLKCSVVSMTLKILDVLDNEPLEGCDITGVKNALNKIKGVSDVVHETGSKRFQVWCIENIENNVLIDQVDGLTGFDATIVPDV